MEEKQINQLRDYSMNTDTYIHKNVCIYVRITYSHSRGWGSVIFLALLVLP